MDLLPPFPIQKDKTAIKLLGQLQRSLPLGGQGFASAPAAVHVAFDERKGSYLLRFKSTALTVNRAHYDKLRTLFDR